EIAMMTADILSKRNEPKINPDWRKLQKEIGDYCMNTRKQGQGITTIQNAIYNPIKLILDLRRVNDMTAEQVPVARKIFEF
ncbi:hypothetical protein, partial [Limosilactobacillus fastidiosus]